MSTSTAIHPAEVAQQRKLSYMSLCGLTRNGPLGYLDSAAKYWASPYKKVRDKVFLGDKGVERNPREFAEAFQAGCIVNKLSDPQYIAHRCVCEFVSILAALSVPRYERGEPEYFGGELQKYYAEVLEVLRGILELVPQTRALMERAFDSMIHAEEDENLAWAIRSYVRKNYSKYNPQFAIGACLAKADLGLEISERDLQIMIEAKERLAASSKLSIQIPEGFESEHGALADIYIVAENSQDRADILTRLAAMEREA